MLRICVIALTTVLTLLPLLIPLLRDVLQAHLSIGVREYGILLSSGMLPAALTTLLVGGVVDRYGASRTASFLLGILSVAVVLLGFSTYFPVFLFATGMLGATSAGLTVAVHTMITQQFPSAKRRMLSANLVIQYCVEVVIALLSERLIIAVHEGVITLAHFFKVTVGIVAFLGTACAVVLFHAGAASSGTGKVSEGTAPFEEETPGKYPSGGMRSMTRTVVSILARVGLTIGRAVPQGPLRYLVVAGALLTAADSTASLWIPRILGSSALGAPSIAPGVAVSLFSFAYVVARSILVFLPENSCQRYLLTAPALVGGLIFCAGILSENQLLYAISYVCGGACWGVVYPTLLAKLSNVAPTKFGSYQSFLLTGSSVITFLLINAMGYLGDVFGDTALVRSALIPGGTFMVASFFAWRYLALERISKQPSG